MLCFAVNTLLLNKHWAFDFRKLFSLNGILPKEVKRLPYCTKCGAKVEETDEFCNVCGTKTTRVVTEEFSVDSDDLIERVKALLHEGNVNRIIVKDDKDKVLLEVPATVGVIGAVLVPWLAALGVIAALAARCRVIVERRE
jgi:hypothetical protein